MLENRVRLRRFQEGREVDLGRHDVSGVYELERVLTKGRAGIEMSTGLALDHLERYWLAAIPGARLELVVVVQTCGEPVERPARRATAYAAGLDLEKVDGDGFGGDGGQRSGWQNACKRAAWHANA